jgi:hypothetical protein
MGILEEFEHKYLLRQRFGCFLLRQKLAKKAQCSNPAGFERSLLHMLCCGNYATTPSKRISFAKAVPRHRITVLLLWQREDDSTRIHLCGAKRQARTLSQDPTPQQLFLHANLSFT